MSIVVRFPTAGLTAETYAAANRAVEEAGLESLPDGLDYHLCFGEDGDLKVSEVWDSQEQFEAFGAKLMPVLAEAGVEFSGEPEIFEVHNSDRR